MHKRESIHLNGKRGVCSSVDEGGKQGEEEGEVRVNN